MGLDGKYLAQARDCLAEIKRTNSQEELRRKSEVYRRAPDIRRIDLRLREIMLDVFGSAMGKNCDIKQLEQESLDLQAKRAERLVELGYDAEYLSEIVCCEKCGDSGYVLGQMCSCLREQYDREVAKSLSNLFKVGNERFERFELKYYDDSFIAGTRVSPRKCMSLVLETCKTYAERFSQGSPNLLFRGGPGLGKTFLSACIAGVVADRGFSVIYVTAGDAFDAFEEKKFSRLNAESDAAERVSRMLACDLLIIDDLGTEAPGALATAGLYSYLNTRISEKKSMIISTNLSEAEIARRYSPQIASRLEGEFEELEFFGRDIRMIKKSGI